MREKVFKALTASSGGGGGGGGGEGGLALIPGEGGTLFFSRT